jgi:hypothetical protein
MVIFLISGFPLLILGAYMYDKINKEGYFDRKYKNDIFDGNRMMTYLVYVAPIMFIYFGIKNKNIKNFIIGILFILIFIGVVILGMIMVGIIKI